MRIRPIGGHRPVAQWTSPVSRTSRCRVTLTKSVRAFAEYGGEVLTHTDIKSGIFIRDPDGQLVELLPLAYAEYVAGRYARGVVSGELGRPPAVDGYDRARDERGAI